MSAIRGAGVWSYQGSYSHQKRAGNISSATSVTTSSIDGSITGSLGALATAGGARLSRIEKAVIKALQKSGPTADANTVVQKAIASAIRNPADDSDVAGGIGDDGTHQLFLQTLSAYGVTPEQFHSDLLAAMQKVQAGSHGQTSTTSSFPAGLVLDTSA